MLSFMALTSLLAANISEAPVNQAFCELGPSFGQGSSDQGRISSRNSLQAGCGYHLLTSGHLSLWSSMRASESSWTVYQENATGLNLRSFQSRGLALGLELQYSISPLWSFHYSLHGLRGQGSLDHSFSTENLRQDLDVSRTNQKQIQHEWAATFQLKSTLSLLAGWQYTDDQVHWDPSQARFFGESVSQDKRLSLNSNRNAWLGSQSQGSFHSSSHELKIGLRITVP